MHRAIQIHNNGAANGPYLLRKELHFFNDLKENYDREAIEFLGFYIGVKDNINIYNIVVA